MDLSFPFSLGGMGGLTPAGGAGFAEKDSSPNDSGGARIQSDLMDSTAGALFLSLLIGSIGLALFLYGKKQARIPQLVGGLLLMAYPYFVSNLYLMGGIALGLIGLLWVAVKAGW
jgi:hypothetical protein